MNVEKIIEALEEKNLLVKDLQIIDLLPNVIDNVILGIVNEKVTIVLDNETTGEKYKNWLNRKGGVFLEDIKKFIKNESHSKYVMIEGEGKKSVVRLIEESEIETFNYLKLIDGRIKDKAYMILKNIKDGENLTSTNRYIKKDTSMFDQKIIVPNISSEDEEVNTSQGNVALFDN